MKKFPTSDKIKRMRGLILEGNGEDENAGVIYDQMITENLSDCATRKRKLSLFRVYILFKALEITQFRISYKWIKLIFVIFPTRCRSMAWIGRHLHGIPKLFKSLILFWRSFIIESLWSALCDKIGRSIYKLYM